jgi:protein gp37
MGSTTEIAWTDATWNPIVGCTPASPGCANCYASEMHDRRHRARAAGKRLPEQYAKPFSTVQCFAERLSVPLHWRKPRRVFVCSTADLFHPDVPDEFIAAVFAVMASRPQHTFQVLTKRPERMRAWFEWGGESLGLRGWRRWSISACDYGTEHDVPLRWQQQAPADWPWPLPNVWLGVTVEDQRAADERIPLLLQTPAALRFLSCEPLIAPVELGLLGTCPESWGKGYSPIYSHLDWVIVGGESGPRARPMDLDWARSLVGQCREAAVPVFVKQLGRRPCDPCKRCGGAGFHHGFGELGHDPDWCLDCGGDGKSCPHMHSLDGRDPAEWPEDLRVQEWPEVSR